MENPITNGFTENPVKIQSELKREPLLADGTKDNRLKIWENRLKIWENRLKIWENYYHVVFFSVHKKEP